MHSGFRDFFYYHKKLASLKISVPKAKSNSPLINYNCKSSFSSDSGLISFFAFVSVSTPDETNPKIRDMFPARIEEILPGSY